MGKLLEEKVDSVSLKEDGGRLRILIISAGMGSSGYYPVETLKEAVKNKVFTAGTHMYIDHPSRSERLDRPERSVRDLAGSLESDGVWDEAEQGIIADVKISRWARELVDDVLGDIGLSIRALGEAEQREIDGVMVPYITSLSEALSVDYVTRAGRGGRVLALIESAQVEERMSRDLADMLRSALPQKTYVRDFDEEGALVVFASYDGDSETLYRQSFKIENGSLELIGFPEEVRIKTEYVPIKDTTKEESMPEIQESRLKELEAAEKSFQESKAESAGLKRKLAAFSKIDSLLGADVDLPQPAKSRIKESVLSADLPATESGELDTSAFETSVKAFVESEQAYIKALTPQPPAKDPKQASNSGVKGFGSSAPVNEAATEYTNPWGRKVSL